MKTLATTLALFLAGSQATNIERRRYFPKHSWQTFGSEELLDVSILQSEELEQYSQKDLSKKLRTTLKDALISESADSEIGKSNAVEKAKYIGSIEKTMTNTIMAKIASSNDMHSVQQLQELKDLNDQSKSIMKVQPAIEDMEGRLELAQDSHTVKYTKNFVNALSELEKAIKEREVATTNQDTQKATSLIQKKHHKSKKEKSESQEAEAAQPVETESSHNVEDPLDGFTTGSAGPVHALTEQEQRELDKKDQAELKKLNEESENAIESSHKMVTQFEKKFNKEHKHDKSDLHKIHKLEKKLKEEFKLKEEQEKIHEKLSEEDAIKDLDHSVEHVKENKKTYLKRELKKRSQDDEQNQIDSKLDKLNEEEEKIEQQKAELKNKLKEKKSEESDVQSKVQMGHYDNLAQKAIQHAQSLQQQYNRIDEDEEENDDDANVQVQVNTFVNDDQQADAADYFDKY